VGSADPAAEVAKLLLAERKRRNLGPLLRDPALDAVANSEVQSAANQGQMKLSGDLAGHVLKTNPDLSSAVGELFVASAPDEAAGSKNIAEPRWTRLGVGAVYAGSKQFGAGRLWVVLLYGR
jgi:uncharacterized protein YkwD